MDRSWPLICAFLITFSYAFVLIILSLEKDGCWGAPYYDSLKTERFVEGNLSFEDQGYYYQGTKW